jgi:hypothetical protein
LNSLETGCPEFNTFPLIPLPATPYRVSFDLKIPFENFTGINPEKTILNLNEFTELYIDILWGDVNDIYAASGLLAEYNVVATVIALEREPVNMSDELEPRKKLIDQSYPLPIESTNLEYLLPENTLIKTLLFLLTVDSTEQRNAVPILNVSIEDDDNAHSMREWSGSQIQSANKMYYGTELVEVGLYAIEFDQLRDLSSMYKTFGVNYPKIKFEFDPTVLDAAKTLELLIRQVTTPPAITVPM